MVTLPGGWRTFIVGYLAWLILFTVLEGAGRQVCRMPTRRWMAAGADARDRTARQWFRDRAEECLDYTRWYRFSMAGLIVVGLGAPLAVAALWRRRLPHTSHVASIGFVAAVALMLLTATAVRWLYDWYA